MIQDFAIGKWDIRIGVKRPSKAHPHLFKRFTYLSGAERVWRFGRLFTLEIRDGEAEVVPVCAECDSDEIGEHGCGDEGWTICSSCRTVEGGYRYISARKAGV